MLLWGHGRHRTCPHDSGKVLPNPLRFISRCRAFAVSCGHHIHPGLTSTRVKQVRFKCLSTPMRGPNNKPLAFVVHGAHSYELGRALLSVAALVRLVATGWLRGSLSFFNRSLCSKAVHIGEHPRQCESRAYECYRSSSEKVSHSH